MIKLIAKMLIIIMCLSFCVPAVSAAETKISLYIDGERMETDVDPIIVNDRTLIPVRCFFEKFNADVRWVAETAQVIITNNDKRIILKIYVS